MRKETMKDLAKRILDNDDFIPSRKMLQELGIMIKEPVIPSKDEKLTPSEEMLREQGRVDEETAKSITEIALKAFNAQKSNYLRSEYSSDRDFNKNLLEIYKTAYTDITAKHGEYILFKPSNINPILEKLMHKLVFDTKLDAMGKIKLIKNTEIDLAYLIKAEHTLSIALRVYAVLGNATVDNEKVCTICLYINTICLIKCIKFGLSKAYIDHFNGGKLKKKFAKYRMVAYNPFLPFIVLTTQEYFDYKALATALSYKEPNDQELFNTVANVVPLSSSYYENMNEFAKLLLDLKYHEIITNPLKIMDEKMSYQVVDKGVFSKRKILVPNNGVVLRIINDKELESILIKEIHSDDNGYFLLTVYRYNNGEELINIHDLQMNTEAPSLNYAKREEDIPALMYIYDFLGIDDALDEIKHYSQIDNKCDYEVISPYYWKYRGLYESSGDYKNSVGKIIKRAFEVEIAAFIRKTNGSASDEAKALAKKLFIDLEDGYTIVKAHKRIYNSKHI